MTREEAAKLIEGLTEEEMVKVYEMILLLRQKRSQEELPDRPE